MGGERVCATTAPTVHNTVLYGTDFSSCPCSQLFTLDRTENTWGGGGNLLVTLTYYFMSPPSQNEPAANIWSAAARLPLLRLQRGQPPQKREPGAAPFGFKGADFDFRCWPPPNLHSISPLSRNGPCGITPLVPGNCQGRRSDPSVFSYLCIYAVQDERGT